jgi:hypothetical protein
MNEMQPDRFANLANLRVELQSAERASALESTDLPVKQSREALVAVIDSRNNCRFDLGRTLSGYPHVPAGCLLLFTPQHCHRMN